MKPKRYISLLLLVLYLFMTVGQVVAAMSCDCVSMRSRSAHVCCHHCEVAHSRDASADSATAMRAPCCTNDHSTEVELYTGTSSDPVKQLRVVVTLLPAALIAEIAMLPEPHACGERFIDRDVVPVLQGWRCVAGLRAPPVLA